jgi:hypothetical protein
MQRLHPWRTRGRESLSDLAALGSFISGIAVVVSFGFLTIQLRQNAQATASNSMSAWLDNFHDMLLSLSGNSSLSCMVRNGLADFDQLSSDEQMQFHAFMASLLLNSQFVFNQRKAGSFDSQIANQILGLSAGMLRTKGGAQWWKFMHGQVAPDFEAQMNSLVQSGKSNPISLPWFRVSAD